MEILLSKLLPLLVYPLSLMLWLTILAWLLLAFRRRGHALAVLGLTIVLLLVCANPTVAYLLVRGLEDDYPPIALEDTPRADAAIVLGGGLGLPLPPRLYPELHGSSDRLLHGLRLYRAGKVDHIILAGGNVFPEPGFEGESFYAAELLREAGVPEQAILVESDSRNTLENARYTAELMRANGLTNVILVTSASHMKRALEAFELAGLDPLPAPVDYNAVDHSRPTALRLMPTVGSLGGTTFALKEHLGRVWYRARGWFQ